jgi:hypothetical protein
MTRIQISLDHHDHALVKREAKAAGVSVPEYVRRAIRQVLPAPMDAPWMRYAGFIESGNGQSSQTIDDRVYSSKD